MSGDTGVRVLNLPRPVGVKGTWLSYKQRLKVRVFHWVRGINASLVQRQVFIPCKNETRVRLLQEALPASVMASRRLRNAAMGVRFSRWDREGEIRNRVPAPVIPEKFIWLNSPLVRARQRVRIPPWDLDE